MKYRNIYEGKWNCIYGFISHISTGFYKKLDQMKKVDVNVY